MSQDSPRFGNGFEGTAGIRFAPLLCRDLVRVALGDKLAIMHVGR